MKSRYSRRWFLGYAVLLAALARVKLDKAFAGEEPSGWQLRRGINVWPWFSLTREYPAPSTEYGWPPFQTQRPVPTEADLQRIWMAGFDFIRLPVDPGPFLAMSFKQKSLLMNMLAEAVGTAVRTGFRVILNVHANSATHYWNPHNLISSLDASHFEAYRSFVGELAGFLAKFETDRVALEPVNEPPQVCTSPTWSDVQMALLTTARKAAPRLMLIATGSCGSMISGLVKLDPTPLLALEPVMFTFHFYEPYLFTHQGAPWMGEPIYRDLNAVPWPASAGSLRETLAAVRARMQEDAVTASETKRRVYAEIEQVLKVYFDAQPDRGFIDHYLSEAVEWGRRYGIAPNRILMGEFGALRSDDRYVAAPAPDRARYIADVRRSAEAMGLPWAFWNLFDGMGVMDDATHALDPLIVDALGLTMPPA